MIHERIINGNNWTFACHTWETSRAWGHEVRLHLNSEEVCKYRIRYYNRTWESYCYQSCMKCAVDKLIAKEREKAVYWWKYQNDKQRISKKQKEELFANDPFLQDLQALYDSI